MKQLFTLVSSTMITLAASAQVSTVTINVTGNREKLVLVDGVTYTATASAAANTNIGVITLTNLAAGQHSLEIRSTVASNRRNTNNSTTFNLRTGYDMTITVGNGGNVQTAETRIRNRGGRGQAVVPMTDANFNTLYRSVQAARSANTKRTTINTAFTTSANRFTSYQVAQLLQLVASESYRLQLAKAVYAKVTDPASFTQVADLLRSTSARAELNAYISANPNNNNSTGYNNNTNYPTGNNYPRSTTPMSDESFRSLLSTVQNAYVSEKVAAIRAAFANTYNSFTVYQAKQLILQTGDESARLELAKAAIPAITDRANFATLYDLFQMQYNRDALGVSIDAYNRSMGTTTTGNAGYTTPMSNNEFAALYNNIQGMWQVQGKYDAVKSSFSGASYFTSSQAAQLLRLISSESMRLELAKLSVRTITDLSNFSQVYDLFSSSSMRNELQVYVNANGGTGSNGSYTGTTYHTPLTDEAFTTLYTNIQKQWIPGAKMSALRTTFLASSTTYVTTAQARQLILLVSDEANRLELAKASYRLITDPTNFTQLYDVLASQASRDQLAEYVRTFR